MHAGSWLPNRFSMPDEQIGIGPCGTIKSSDVPGDGDCVPDGGDWLLMEVESVRYCAGMFRNRRVELLRHLTLPAFVVAAGACVCAAAAEEQAIGLQNRIPWTSSRLAGSPEPPLPYTVRPVFTAISWDRPIYAEREPGTNSLIVIEQGGERDRPSRLFRVPDDPSTSEKHLLLEVPDRLVYGMTFHPDYERNGVFFVFSNGPREIEERTTRVTRFAMFGRTPEERTVDRSSEEVIIEWRSLGHDGGGLVFGHDRMLYVTAGDGTSDSDAWQSAQDISSLAGSILRIDVDHPDPGRLYSIPADNPFVDHPRARGEIWALGLRNPWRMTIDARTGRIWVGNNGQDLWETVHLVRRGDNYGWSVYEGSHPFYAHRELGPGRLTPPVFEHHHSESRSLTGGIVYYGDRLPNLSGAYVYGDYSTGKIWAGRHDGQKVTFHQEIADTPLRIVAFAESRTGDLLVIDHDSGFHRLERNPAADHPEDLPVFPRTLGETGLFESVAEHRMADGVLPFDVVEPGWADGATAERFLAVPDDLQVHWTGSRGWNFPDRSVLVQTLSIDESRDGHVKRRRIETRILLKQQGEWAGYTYEWNADQTDALLVDAGGRDITLTTSQGSQSWRIPSRAECLSCHSRAANYVLGMTHLQMDRDIDYQSVGGHVGNQVATLAHIGLLTGDLPAAGTDRRRLVRSDRPSASLEDRVKSWLHVNCSCCHVAAGGGNARMELEFTTPLEDMKILDEYPQHATFGFRQPRIISPGDPDQSVMLARLSRRGRGQMPPLVSRRIDDAAVALFREWIASLKPNRRFVRDWSMADLLPHLDDLKSGRSLVRGRELFRSSGCGQCHRIEKELAGIGPNLTDAGRRLTARDVLEAILDPSAKIDPRYAQTILVTVDGRVLRGRVVSETDEQIVLQGAETFGRPALVAKADVEERFLSDVSMMPQGAVRHLQRDEILDLVAYVLAGSAPQD